MHGEGDRLGAPARVLPPWRYVLNRMFEYDPRTGQLLYNRVLIGIPKGNIKTETTAQIGLAELAGPIAPISPNIQIAAASWGQANELFTAARLSILGDENDRRGPLADYFREKEHILDDRILHPERRGVLRRIAAIGATNDGTKETCSLNDELHEWEGERREQLWTVKSKGVRKRQAPRPLRPDVAAELGVDTLFGTLIVGITTQTDKGPDSLLGRLYDHGRKVAIGEVDDPSLLFVWWEASPGYDLDDPAQLRAAIIEANPCVGFVPGLLDSILEAFRDPSTTRSEDERYNLNRKVDPPKAWLPEASVLAKRKVPDAVAPLPAAGTPLVLALDGSYNRDSTALVGWTLDDYGFVLEAWEKDDYEDPFWTVPRDEVDATIFRALKRWKVLELAVDPPGWHRELEEWEREFGALTLIADGSRLRGSGLILRFETNQPARMQPATDAFASAMRDPESTLRIDGDPRLLRHIRNARTRKGRYGSAVEKEHKDSPRKIDLAVAAIVARSRAMWWAQKGVRKQRAAGSGGAYMVID